MAREPKYLDYHDVLLYRSDVDLLKGKYWLNDQVRSDAPMPADQDHSGPILFN